MKLRLKQDFTHIHSLLSYYSLQQMCLFWPTQRHLLLSSCLQPSRPGYPSPRSSEGVFPSPQLNHFPVWHTHTNTHTDICTAPIVQKLCSSVPSHPPWLQKCFRWQQQPCAGVQRGRRLDSGFPLQSLTGIFRIKHTVTYSKSVINITNIERFFLIHCVCLQPETLFLRSDFPKCPLAVQDKFSFLRSHAVQFCANYL